MSSSAPQGASPWWDPNVYADRRPRLKARGRIRSAFRTFFERHGFDEVETAALQASPGNEAHIAAFATSLALPVGGDWPLYLHTSPEFACKKLLAAGESRIYAFGHVFRNGERGPLHHPEFTMCEWYRAHEPYGVLIEDCAELLAAAAEAAGTERFRWRGRSCDPFLEPERLGVCEAFDRYAEIDLAATLSREGNDREALAAEAARIGVRVVEDDDWSDLFSKILSDRVEPRLGLGRPTVLDLYPASEAALARRSLLDPRLAERFELYACGVELANAFGELTDADEQRRRFEAEMELRRRIYGDDYPIDEDFLAALEIMPEASGIALGFDRLVMLATGAERIEDVLWTPVDGPRS